MRTPMRYIGSKQRLSNILLRDFIPKHLAFVEVFGGSGAMLFNKSPDISGMEVYNDINSNLVTFFKVLREQPQELQRLCQLTPYSREQHKECRRLMATTDISELERAWCVFTTYRQGYAGKDCSGWGFSTQKGNHALTIANVADNLLPLAARIRQVSLENGDFAKIIKQYGKEGNFLYCDPPYMPETRNQANDACYCTDDEVCYRCSIYKDEMPVNEHERFLKCIYATPAMAIVSGYDCEMYEDYLSNWSKYKMKVPINCTNVSGATKKWAEEIIWVNPACEIAKGLPI